MAIEVGAIRSRLEQFDFQGLFTEELGWSQPASRQRTGLDVNGTTYALMQVSQLSGVVVLEVTSADGPLPGKEARAAIQRLVSQQYHENLLIFVDGNRAQTLWYWVKRDGSRRLPREHFYAKGQPAELFISKISAMFVDISDLDERGNVPVIEVAGRLRQALDVEPVTKRFYAEFRDERLKFAELIYGIPDEKDRSWYASVLLNRLMFIYFLQGKGFLDAEDFKYLQRKLEQSKARRPDGFYEDFLLTLFFEGFAKPEEHRSSQTRALIGKVRYLNGGLFLKHPVEERWQDISVTDAAFDGLFHLFERYSWNLDDTPGSTEELNPDVLGYIFEKYINQKAFGAYYTRPEITEYLSEQTIHRLILDKLESPALPGIAPARHFDSVPELLMNLDVGLCRALLHDVLPGLSVLDPACGSGAFLVAAMRTLRDIYGAVIGKIPFLGDGNLDRWLGSVQREHPSIPYFVKKKIITENLYGVDIMEEGTEIAKLRLFLALVSSIRSVDQLEPLPNVDFNILAGNSLIGLLRVDESAFEAHDAQPGLFRKSYQEVVAEKDRLVRSYKNATSFSDDLQALRNNIQERREDATHTLDEILLDQFRGLGIRYEQATWDAATSREGRPKKRSVSIGDVRALRPFHWGYELDQVLNERGGFDAIITNPPWEIFKPQAKEFFSQHSDLVTKNKMHIEEFEDEKAILMRSPDVRDAWLEYLSAYPYVSAFYRSAPQYANQISIVAGKKVGTDVNLFKLFTEQCFNLLRDRGQCGIVIPSGIYTDLGAKQLREMLFGQTQVSGLFCFENRKAIFEAVDSRFKFVVLTYGKGGRTGNFPAAFMRHDVSELASFPAQGALSMSTDLVRRLSPDSLSVMELKSPLDVRIAEKMARFPTLGAKLPDVWNLTLTAEFHMTNDFRLFKAAPGPGRLPLYEGKMVHQFDARFGNPRYWVDEQEGRRALLKHGQSDAGQPMDYQGYRLGVRAIAASTNERTLICGPVPRDVFCGNSLLVLGGGSGTQRPTDSEALAAQSMLNSFVVDYYVRQMVSANINMFFIYQIPVPRLTAGDVELAPLVDRAARLICTTPEFDDLAREVGLRGHEDGVTDPTGRALLRAELDGTVAHLYGLTDEEFAHVLTTFPLVAQSVKDAALDAYRALAPNPDDAQIAALIRRGEGPRLELKAAARRLPQAKENDGSLGTNIVQGVAAFMNSEGGMLLVGVSDKGSVLGLETDYLAADRRKPNRDGYELFLSSLLASGLGADASSFYRIEFHRLEGKDVCRIAISPSPHPIYVNGDLYIRAGNGKRKLNVEEATKYLKHHWPSS